MPICIRNTIHSTEQSTYNQFTSKVAIEKMESLVNYESDDGDLKINKKNRSRVNNYISITFIDPFEKKNCCFVRIVWKRSKNVHSENDMIRPTKLRRNAI